MLEGEVLVGESLAKNAQTSCAITLDEVATLNHEVLGDAVERAILVTDTTELRKYVEMEKNLGDDMVSLKTVEKFGFKYM